MNPWPIILVIWVGFALLVGYQARIRHRSAVLYFFASLIGSPILAFIMLAFDGGNRPPPVERAAVPAPPASPAPRATPPRVPPPAAPPITPPAPTTRRRSPFEKPPGGTGS